MSDHIFDWYTTMLEQAQWEIEYAWKRFESFVKFHLFVAGGMLALGSYAVLHNDINVLVIGLGIAAFGVFNANMLWKALQSSAEWESIWFTGMADIENSPEFQAAVGSSSIKVMSQDTVKIRFAPEEKKRSMSRKLQNDTINKFRWFYMIMLCAGCIKLVIMLLV